MKVPVAGSCLCLPTIGPPHAAASLDGALPLCPGRPSVLGNFSSGLTGHAVTESEGLETVRALLTPEAFHKQTLQASLSSSETLDSLQTELRFLTVTKEKVGRVFIRNKGKEKKGS